MGRPAWKTAVHFACREALFWGSTGQSTGRNGDRGFRAVCTTQPERQEGHSIQMGRMLPNQGMLGYGSITENNCKHTRDGNRPGDGLTPLSPVVRNTQALPP